VFASVMRSVNAGVHDYGAGVSLGYNVMDNLWLSLGYNVRGLNDRDFNDAGYSARGLFVSLRMKVDQDTFGLNKRSENLRPITREP
jgi:opacity protein-like surface antigen